MSFIKKIEKQNAVNRIVLTKTLRIQESDKISDPVWIDILNDYKDSERSSWEIKALVSLINSILYQERSVFVLTRKSLRSLLAEDQNRECPLGLKNESYTKFIDVIFRADLAVKVFHSQSEGKPMIFKVIDADILKHLKVNQDAQMEEAMAFVQNKIQKTHPFDKIETKLRYYQKEIDGYGWVDLIQILKRCACAHYPDEYSALNDRDNHNELISAAFDHVEDEDLPGNEDYIAWKKEKDSIDTSFKNLYAQEYQEHPEFYSLSGGRLWTKDDRQKAHEEYLKNCKPLTKEQEAKYAEMFKKWK